MTTFKYKAISNNGAVVSGVVKAYNEFEAVEQIKQTCSVVTKITPIDENGKGKDILPPPKIKEKTLAMMCSQFSIILSAGMPIVRAVSLISHQVQDKDLRKILVSVADNVASGYSLAKSFEAFERQLPMTFIETIRAGEESGTLEQSFAKLHTYFDKSAKIKGKVISALTYPAFTLVVAAIVIVVIMAFAVPKFTSTFLELGVELPLPTLMLIGMSNFFVQHGLTVVIVIAVLVIGLKIFSKTERGKCVFAKAVIMLPVIGKIVVMKAASNFSSTMSTLLTAGLPMVKALSVTAKVIGNHVMSLKLTDAAAGVQEGKRLADCIKKCDELPELLVEMTGVGEETGSLEETLGVLSDFYDNEVDMTSSKALSLIEPVIICILAVFVVFVLLSVYLPMFSMYDSI